MQKIPIFRIFCDDIIRNNAYIFYCLAGLIQQLLRNVEYRDVSSTDLDMSNNSGCACVQYNCGCCAHIEVVKIRLNDTGIKIFNITVDLFKEEYLMKILG